MLKQIARYVLIIVGLVALAIATSTETMEYIWAAKKGDKWWSANLWTNGNLVGMAHLDFVQKFVSPAAHTVMKPESYNGSRNAVLYICGDSYAWALADSQFAGISAYHYINRYQGGYYRLDTTKNNILIVEVGEMLIKDYFEGPRLINELKDSTTQKHAGVLCNTEYPHILYSAFPFGISIGKLFNKRINQNLESLLFNYNFIMPVFQTKAALNYFFFNRASGNVVISRNRDFLFDKGSVTNTGSGAYAPVTDGDINRIVNTLNTIYEHYKAAGFEEVYVALIPSTPAIVEPEGYNGLIPRIQAHPDLSIKQIDIYSEFRGYGSKYLSYGDTHWNMNGEQKWIDIVNEQLIKHQELKCIR